MVHVATVHWQNEGWIDIQLRYLNRHISEAFRVYAFLNGIPEIHRAKYFYSSCEPLREHAVKLNALAETIGKSSGDDGDVIIFLDGDAFPIADILPLVRGK